MTNLKYTPEEPIAAIATALAPSALGIVRCSGKMSIELVSKIFSRPRALCAARGNEIVYGWIVGSDGVKIDEVLVSGFRAPKSFTGEDMVEISCHGGVNVVMAIFNVLVSSGFRRAERGEFTFRAFINGKTDLTRAEAIREIIDSKTNESRTHAAGRLSGNLFETIDVIKKKITDILAGIEVEIEYPEDEETIADSFDSSELLGVARELSDLASSWKSEKIYQDGARVVLCGKTNAGKSSLFNSLLKEDRAIVSDIEGTTRDFIESWIDFDGIPARLFDTAGLRQTDDVIEQKGVEITKDLSHEADLILYLVDSTVGLTEADVSFLEEYAKNDRSVALILVFTKADVSSVAQKKTCSLPADFSSIPLVTVSSKSGEGIFELCAEVKKRLSFGEKSERTRAGLGSERQKVCVSEALSCVRHALSLTKDYALDAVVQDLEDALDFLGEVTGEVTADDVLGSIFSRFCVGK